MSITRIKYNPEIEYEMDEYGNKIYYKIGTGIIHRLDGPAAEFLNKSKYWYQNNRFHRTDGPAIEYESGYKEYYIYGKYVNFNGTNEEWIIKNLLE